MVTFLDIGLLKAFDLVYAFIFVWAIVFAVLQKTKVIGESAGINAIISVAAAFMVLLSGKVVEMINFMIPWFTVAIIFFLLVILVFQIFGLKEADVAHAAKDKGVYWTLIGVFILIVVASFSTVFGQSFLEAGAQVSGQPAAEEMPGTTGKSFEQNVTATLFHPKVLGMIVLFAIAIMAVALLTQG